MHSSIVKPDMQDLLGSADNVIKKHKNVFWENLWIPWRAPLLTHNQETPSRFSFFQRMSFSFEVDVVNAS